MRLELFDLIDDSVKLLELNNPSYQYVEGAIKGCFEHLLEDYMDYVVRLRFPGRRICPRTVFY